jgi:predicted phage terminase large subunit-like protein
MNNLTPNEYLTVLRSDFITFIEKSFYQLNPDVQFLPNWHIEVIASELDRCLRGETKRLIICVPPRSLKSHCPSVAFPAWLLGHKPSARIICASYGQDLAEKLALDCRSLMNSDWYGKVFSTRLSPQRQAVSEFMTESQGSRLATSVGGVVTGLGGDFMIIDDPLKPDQAVSDTQRNAVNEWYERTLYSRLNDKATGCIIIIMQRLHEDDLVGHLVQQGGWKVLKFPAIAVEDETHVISTRLGQRTVQRRVGEALHPERESLDILENIRRTLGEYNFSGQYQQEPAPLGGGMVKLAWFKTYQVGEQPANFDLVFQSWDTAVKATELSDYSVCTTWGMKNKNLYLLHVFRRRMEYPDLKRAVWEQFTNFKATTVLIEDKSSGAQLIQELIREGLHAVTPYEPKMEKIMRMHSVTSTMENGFVYLPEKAHWLADYLHELTTFPNGRFDDQCDSTSQALDWVKTGYGFEHYLRVMKFQADRTDSDTSGEQVEARVTRADMLNGRWRFQSGHAALRILGCFATFPDFVCLSYKTSLNWHADHGI